ncbi:MAG: type II toxin-antitoxin system mRNA interferase toxin, RelE/StbE family [Robiginitomaculum sp.]|nr:MAG: type II toxin-antitoxin system mRNA interferase toxin, RelE/StbE family [Robiginitomaculum sp.]
MQIIWAPSARADMYQIFEFIMAENPVAAVSVLDQIERSVEHLSAHPEIGRRGHVLGTRELIIPNTPYMVVYRVTNDQIEIASILHESRDWPDPM